MFISRKFLIYGFIGVFVTCMKLATLFALRDLFRFDEFVSITFSYAVAVVLHYFLNKHITFMIKEVNVVNIITLKYFVTILIAYVFYTSNIYIFNNIVGTSFYVSVFIALVLSYIFNYFLYDKFVFRKNFIVRAVND